MSDPREYFNTCPLIKVKLPIKIKENKIQEILDYVMIKSQLNLIRLNNGFILANPKREIRFSEAKYGFIKTLDVYHKEFHFDPEIEGLHLAIIINLVNKYINNIYISDAYMQDSINHNKHQIFVRLYHDPIHEKLISRVIKKFDSSQTENIHKLKNGFIYDDMTFVFKKPKNKFVNYMKCRVQRDILINLEEEEKINRIIGLIFYAHMNVKESKEIVDSSDSE